MKLFKKYWAVILFLSAVAIRIIYFFQLKEFILFKQPVLDAEVYNNWALSILHGDILSRNIGTFVLSPLYAYFLSFLYLISGAHIAFAVFIQCIIGSLSCVLIYLITKRIFNSAVAVMSSLIAAFYGYSIYLDGMLLTGSLIVFFNLLGLFLLIVSFDNKRKWVWILISGVSFGLSSLLRPNILLFVLFAILWFIHKKEFKKYIIFVIGVILALSPVILRNYIVNKEFMLTSSSSGMNFYLGNNESSTGIYSPPEFDQADPFKQGENYRKKAGNILNKELTHSEASKFWFSEGLKSISKNPWKWFKLTGKKILLCFNFYEIPMNFNYYFYKSQFSVLNLPFIISSGAVFYLGLLGFILYFFMDSSGLNSDKNNFILLFIYFISYISALVLFFISSEYRYPVVFVLIIMSSYSLYSIFNLAKSNSYKKLAVIAFLLTGIFIFTRLPVYSISNGQQLSQEYMKLGVAFIKSGNVDEGIKSFEKGLGYFPENGDLNFNLAHAYLYEKKQYELSVEKYKEALKYATDIYTKEKSWLELAEAYRELKKNKDSLACYQEALKINNNNASTHQFIGNLYYILKDKKSALKEWEISLKLRPDNPELRKNIKLLRIK